MLSDFINSAIKEARYEILPEDNSVYSEIPVCQGVYAKAKTFEECRRELIEVLEEWIIFRLQRNLPIPTINNINLNIKKQQMPPIKPLKRKELIYYLKKAGYEGPYWGGKHQFMQKIPNPHETDIDKSFLIKILKQAEISRDNWENL